MNLPESFLIISFVAAYIYGLPVDHGFLFMIPWKAMLSSKYLVFSAIDLDIQASKQPECPENQNRMILKALSNSKWQLSLVRHIAACSTGRALNPWNMLLFISNTTILISIWIFMMIQFAMNAFSIHGIIWSWRDWMSRLEAHRIEASELLAARRG